MTRSLLFLSGSCVLSVLGILWATFISLDVYSEDAAILYRYAINLAETGVVSYNPGGPPAEGATDFLYMMLIAGLYRIGFEAYSAALLINFTALAAIIEILRRRFDLGFAEIIALFLALLLLSGSYAAYSGFNIFLFQLALVVAALSLADDRVWQFFIAGFVACLIRPDGIVFVAAGGAFLLLKNRDRRTLAAALIGAVAPGVIYFIWRYSYFDELLPLPFYVKSDADRIVFGFATLDSTLRFIDAVIPTLVAAPLALAWLFSGSISASRKSAIIFSFLIVPTIFYLSMRLDQNINNRFFHYIPALTLLLALDMPRRPPLRAYALVAVALVSFAQEPSRINSVINPSQLQALGKELSLFSPLKIAVTEAGHLPLQSGAETVDLWGLNTPEFAHKPANGSAVENAEFDLIVLHYPLIYRCLDMQSAHDASLAQRDILLNAPVERDWNSMVQAVLSGIAPTEYTLWALAHTPGTTNPDARHDIYFVRNQGAHAPQITGVLGKLGGELCR